MGKRIVLTEYPNLEKYPKVETMLDSEALCGYTQRTTFWDDFTIAERWGVKAIEDTYKNAFQSCASRPYTTFSNSEPILTL